MATDIPALQRLHDIHLPTPISMGFLAPGWYLVMLSLSAIALLIFIKIRRLRKQKHYKESILQMLYALEKEHAQKPNSQKTCAGVSELLRRVALTCYPRAQVAGLQGDSWLDFLSQTSAGALPAQTRLSRTIFRKKPHTQAALIDFSTLHLALVAYPYQPPVPADISNIPIEKLFEAANLWIQNQAVYAGILVLMSNSRKKERP